MNKTTNYQLNQWVKDDQVRMEDFNADNAKIDAAVKAEANARTAGDAALSTRVDGLSAGKADASALAALSQTVAQERIHVGSFVGDGATSRTIQLSWAPTFMIIFGPISDYYAPFFLIQGHCQYVGEYSPGLDITYTPKLNGTSLTLTTWGNYSGKTSYYILFR